MIQRDILIAIMSLSASSVVLKSGIIFFRSSELGEFTLANAAELELVHAPSYRERNKQFVYDNL